MRHSSNDSVDFLFVVLLFLRQIHLIVGLCDDNNLYLIVISRALVYKGLQPAHNLQLLPSSATSSPPRKSKFSLDPARGRHSTTAILAS